MKIRKYYIIFVYILQGKMGKTKKNGKKITQPKCPKYQKPKDGDEQNKVKASKINVVMKVRTSVDPYPCTIFSPRFIKRSLGFIEKIVDSKSFC